jgi:hypothetical protein
MLMEMGIGLRPMPTAAICKAFNELRQDLVNLVELQRRVAAKEYQVGVLKDQKTV